MTHKCVQCGAAVDDTDEGYWLDAVIVEPRGFHVGASMGPVYTVVGQGFEGADFLFVWCNAPCFHLWLAAAATRYQMGIPQ